MNTRLLDDVFSHLTRLDRPSAGMLQPGLDRRLIDAAFSLVGLEPTTELVDLYLWRDGTGGPPETILDDMHFFPGFYLLSLREAAEQYEAARGDERWSPGWFPVFANGGGDFYVVDLGSSDGDGNHRESAPVIGFLLGESDHPVEYQSLEAMFETLRECFESEVFFVTGEGYLEMDDARHAAIAAKHNPEVELWREAAS